MIHFKTPMRQMVFVTGLMLCGFLSAQTVREEATLGARTTLDVLDAEQNLLDARATRATAVAQRYVGVYNLLSSMGLLSVEHLKLGVPTYDPSVYYNAVKTAPVTSAQGKAMDRILGKVSSGN